MLRWFGAGLILCGGIMARQTVVRAAAAMQRTRCALAELFDTLRAEIEAFLSPLPLLLCRLSDNAFAAQAAKRLKAGATLERAWEDAARTLPLTEREREQVAALGKRLDAEEKSVCAALSLAASALRQTYEKTETERHANERLITSAFMSISLFIIIFLL